jgi:ribosomal-protein-alanine N-acetyltransferase
VIWITSRRSTALDPVDCTIRSAKWEDLNHVLSIEEQSFPPEEAFPPWIFINMLKLNPELFIVVDCGNTVKGYAIGVVEDNTCHLISIAIAPGSRRQGLGRKLLRSFKSVCKDKGLTSITLEDRQYRSSDLLPAPRGFASRVAPRFPPSIRVYICHLGGSWGGQSSPTKPGEHQSL